MLYDCFIFFNELDILEIRLHEMSPVVDRFVLVEATKTFQGASKPLYFEENKTRFAPFLDKIEHIIIDYPTDRNQYRNAASPAWAREYYQRDQIARGLDAVQPSDLILVSDVDEIVKATALQKAKSTLRQDEMGIFTGNNYAHYLNRQVTGSIWQLGPRLCYGANFSSAQLIRNTKLNASRSLKNSFIGAWHTRFKNWIDCGFAGPLIEYEQSIWHFTSIGGWERFREKINAFAHEEERDNIIYKSEAAFNDHINSTSEKVSLQELPHYIASNPERFAAHLDLNVV
jgi:beta-1,4-mannosyl-glycoprotein beta-1,4-N-acetylglucosaminyltransferase